jgi:AcrR family transcriptional regulator
MLAQGVLPVARTPKVVEDRREQIMDAGLRVFAQKGFARASNKDVARAAGITPGLIYHYFVSKEALLKAIIEARSPVHLVRSLPAEMLGLPPDALLRAFVGKMVEFVEDESFVRLLRVFLAEMIHDPNMSPFGTPAVQEATKFLQDYLAAKMETGELRRTDPALAVQVLMGSVMAFVLRRQVLRDPVVLRYSHEQLVDAIVSVTLQGLLPR